MVLLDAAADEPGVLNSSGLPRALQAGGGGMKLIGYLLIAFGLVALILGGISYVDRDEVVDLGGVEVTSEERKTIPLSPIAGIAALAGGVALVVAGSRTRV
jgi:hypothetical protein